jgi:hypothetical protein
MSPKGGWLTRLGWPIHAQLHCACMGLAKALQLNLIRAYLISDLIHRINLSAPP